MKSKYSLLEIKAAYAVFGLPVFVSYAMVKKKFRELAKTGHPDKGANVKKFMKVMQAKEVLYDFFENVKLMADEQIYSRYNEERKLKGFDTDPAWDNK